MGVPNDRFCSQRPESVTPALARGCRKIAGPSRFVVSGPQRRVGTAPDFRRTADLTALLGDRLRA
jgi:hypothetical protein